MQYSNPVIAGFYPDPSVCRAGEHFYLAASSFQYFPGVPLFESADLVNWKKIGHALTQKSQIDLSLSDHTSGVFAPTLRYHDGRFYMVTSDATSKRNFYVFTDNIHGSWSEPVYVDQNGIDPSPLFDGGRVYFISNGEDDQGRGGIIQCEIDIETGEKRSPSRCVWQGTGGRYLEAPHMYHIGPWYYLLASEGGTEYGHMVVCARSGSVWGPFENHPENPILTNRNQAPGIIQGIGHGDLIQGPGGNWHMFTLGFRQIHLWQTYHTLGREVFLAPVEFDGDGWFSVGDGGVMKETYTLAGEFTQVRKMEDTFENTIWDIDWCFLRHPNMENYRFGPSGFHLSGSKTTLDEAASPTFIALRQRGFDFELTVDVRVTGTGAGGVTCYMCEDEHYDLEIRKVGTGYEAALKLNIGGIKHTAAALPLESNCGRLLIRADSMRYRFFAVENGTERFLGQGASKYLSSEVSGGFTGTMLGLYAVGNGEADFQNLHIVYV